MRAASACIKKGFMAMRKIDWHFVTKWSIGFTIFVFGVTCMTARDAGMRAYYLAALENQQVNWTTIESKILTQLIVSSLLDFILFIFLFLTLAFWSYFSRKTPNYSELDIQNKIKVFLNLMLGISTIICIIFFYYATIKESHILPVEGIIIFILIYFARSKQNLIICYLLLAVLLYLLVKYTLSIEGNRFIVVSLYSMAVTTWLTSSWLWKTKPH